MGTTKNIEMREYNRSDYNLLIPKTDSYTKEKTLSSYTKTLLKLSSSAVPDDAFLALFLGVDSHLYRVKVQLSDGTPVSGSIISGLSAVAGQTLTTGDDGMVVGKSTNTSVTIDCTSPYIDQKAPDSQSVSSTGTINDVTLTLSNNTEMQTINSSKTARISPLAKTLDITAVGGGGGGGGKLNHHDDRFAYTHAGGGGGGYAETITAHLLSNNKKIDIIVGSGGNAGTYVFSESDSGLYGGTGGTTTVKIDDAVVCTANGGKGGRGGNHSYTIPLGGDGNGAGGSGGYYTTGDDPIKPTSGIAGSKYIFNEQGLGLAGGGGGGGGGAEYDEKDVNAGGAPNGGNGLQ